MIEFSFKFINMKMHDSKCNNKIINSSPAKVINKQ